MRYSTFTLLFNLTPTFFIKIKIKKFKLINVKDKKTFISRLSLNSIVINIVANAEEYKFECVKGHYPPIYRLRGIIGSYSYCIEKKDPNNKLKEKSIYANPFSSNKSKYNNPFKD